MNVYIFAVKSPFLSLYISINQAWVVVIFCMYTIDNYALSNAFIATCSDTPHLTCSSCLCYAGSLIFSVCMIIIMYIWVSDMLTVA